MKGINQYLIRERASIKAAMHRIDCGGCQVAFVVGAGGRLLGSISDGDIRRAILRGVDIKSSVAGIMNRKPVVLPAEASRNPLLARQALKRLLAIAPGSRVIPAVSPRGVPTGLFSCLDLKPFGARRAGSSRFLVGKVLVVGGAGYLGSVLASRLLDNGYKVRVLDMLMFGKGVVKDLLDRKGFQLIQGDLRNIAVVSKALSGMDAVVNLAAVVGDAACSLSPEEAIETNYLANKALAEACKYHQINRFLYASTCSVYGVGSGPLNEGSPLNPVSLYARSKIRSEEGILSLEDANFSPTILRMATLYGLSPRMRYDLVLNRMTMTACRENKIYVIGGGSQWRPLLSVKDAAESYVRCLEAPIEKVKGQVFNVGSDRHNHQVKEIARIVARVVRGARVVVEGTDGDKRNYFVSFKKIESSLGYLAKDRLDSSVREIQGAIADGRISDFDNPIYYNAESANK